MDLQLVLSTPCLISESIGYSINYSWLAMNERVVTRDRIKSSDVISPEVFVFSLMWIFLTFSAGASMAVDVLSGLQCLRLEVPACYRTFVVFLHGRSNTLFFTFLFRRLLLLDVPLLDVWSASLASKASYVWHLVLSDPR